MIKLYQFKRAFGLPNMSPFCMKVETWLRLAGLEYEMVLLVNPRKAPKGKGPYIEDDGRVIADSTFILDYLRERYRVGLDDNLSPAQQASAHAFSRLLEERFYWVMVYSRWLDERCWPTIRKLWFGGLPPVLKSVVPRLVQKEVRKTLHLHGIGRHSADDIYRLGADDLASVAAFLDDKPFFLGEAPTTVDAVVFAFMANTIQVPLETPLQESARALPNLAAYCERMRSRYFSDLDAP